MMICTMCLQDIRPGEAYGRAEKRRVCIRCLEKEWATLSAKEKFSIMGYLPYEEDRIKNAPGL